MTFRTVSVDMWRKDDWFAELAPDAKLVWIYTFTNDSTSPAGIYRIALRTIANDTGIAPERVKEIIAEFSEAGKLYYENGVIWPVTMRKHQTGELKKTDNLLKKIFKDLDDLPDGPLLKHYREYYRVSIVYPEGVDTVSEPLASPLQAPTEGIERTSAIQDTRHLTQDTRYKTQDRETGEVAPPKSKPPKSQHASHDPNLDHPAVALYREIARLTAPVAVRQDIIDTVTDLKHWEDTMRTWIRKGFKPGNIDGMLQCYREGFRDRGNGKGPSEPHEHPGITAVRLLMEEEAEEARQQHGNTP